MTRAPADPLEAGARDYPKEHREHREAERPVVPIRPENRDRYPADWPAISLAIKERAGWRCECLGECGRGTHGAERCPNVHGEPAYGTGSKVVLTTAHLDHTPENCDDANLRAYCNGCHLHYDRDHHAETRNATRAAELAAQMEPLFDIECSPSAAATLIRPKPTRRPRAAGPDDWGVYVNECGIFASGIAADRWVDFTLRAKDDRLTMLWTGPGGGEWHVMCGTKADAVDALETFLGVGFHKAHVKVARLAACQAKAEERRRRVDERFAARELSATEMTGAA